MNNYDDLPKIDLETIDIAADFLNDLFLIRIKEKNGIYDLGTHDYMVYKMCISILLDRLNIRDVVGDGVINKVLMVRGKHRYIIEFFDKKITIKYDGAEKNEIGERTIVIPRICMLSDHHFKYVDLTKIMVSGAVNIFAPKLK